MERKLQVVSTEMQKQEKKDKSCRELNEYVSKRNIRVATFTFSPKREIRNDGKKLIPPKHLSATHAVRPTVHGTSRVKSVYHHIEKTSNDGAKKKHDEEP
jgi:hypothetical protein